MQREGAFHADAKRLLAHGEGLTHPLSLALDRDALKDLRAPPRALDDDKMHAQAVAGPEVGNAAQLGALDGVDDGAHGKEKARTTNTPARRGILARRPRSRGHRAAQAGAHRATLALTALCSSRSP